MNKVRREKVFFELSLETNLEKFEIVAFTDSPFGNLQNGGSQGSYDL